MKVQSNLKNIFAKSFFALLLFPVSSDLLAQTQPQRDLKDFKITIENTESGIRMQSLQGSAWLNLSFSIGNDKPQAIDEYGMTKMENVSPTKDPKLADFLFTITRSDNKIVLKGIEGAAWTELSFTLSQNGKQTIDRFGMTE